MASLPRVAGSPLDAPSQQTSLPFKTRRFPVLSHFENSGIYFSVRLGLTIIKP